MSKRIFFIVPYPFGEAPSQRFRFEQYIPYLKDNGYEIEIHPFYDYKTWQTLYSEGNILKKAWGVFSSFMRRFALLFKFLYISSPYPCLLNLSSTSTPNT